jgi:ketol-acid reductoisomerase
VATASLTDETKAEMRKVLSEIQDGSFAKQWLTKTRNGRPEFLARRNKEGQLQLEEVGKELRAQMSWKS